VSSLLAQQVFVPYVANYVKKMREENQRRRKLCFVDRGQKSNLANYVKLTSST
jgi:hypothetical protein